jgi:hypothetical protein
LIKQATSGRALHIYARFQFQDSVNIDNGICPIRGFSHHLNSRPVLQPSGKRPFSDKSIVIETTG